MKRFLTFLFFAAFLLCIPVSAKRFTHGFKVGKMELEIPYHPEWEIDAEASVLAKEILNQPFKYLDRGAQCYVFASKDGQYVVKFFRYDQTRFPLGNPLRKLFHKRKKTPFQAKVNHLFDACKVAYELARKETGLVYIHLNQGSAPVKVLKCKDSLGRSYKIPLENYRFALQKRAEPFRKTLISALDQPSVMQQRIDAFLFLLQSRTAKGISNSDPNLSRNFGFIETQAVEIDFGNYTYNSNLLDPACQKSEMERYVKRLRRWLKKNAPEWTSYLDNKVRDISKTTKLPNEPQLRACQAPQKDG